MFYDANAMYQLTVFIGYIPNDLPRTKTRKTSDKVNTKGFSKHKLKKRWKQPEFCENQRRYAD